jgi:hypothetical protein
MLDWIADTLLKIVNYVPALFVAQDSANFMLIRAMFGLMLIVLIVVVIAGSGYIWSAISRRLRDRSAP